MYSFGDAFISLLSLVTLGAVLYLVRNAFKKHYLNVFSHMMLILIVFALVSKYSSISLRNHSSLVRAAFFVTDLKAFKFDPEEGTIASKPKVFAFFWTYPLINFIVISYTVSSHWVYDLMTIMHANQAPVALRRQMKVFVVAIVIFVIIMYLVYMLSLPQTTAATDLPQIFFYLAIFEWLVAAILFISIFLYVKRISSLNAQYGRAVAAEATVFILSNVAAGIFNYKLS